MNKDPSFFGGDHAEFAFRIAVDPYSGIRENSQFYTFPEETQRQLVAYAWEYFEEDHPRPSQIFTAKHAHLLPEADQAQLRTFIELQLGQTIGDQNPNPFSRHFSIAFRSLDSPLFTDEERREITRNIVATTPKKGDRLLFDGENFGGGDNQPTTFDFALAYLGKEDCGILLETLLGPGYGKPQTQHLIEYLGPESGLEYEKRRQIFEDYVTSKDGWGFCDGFGGMLRGFETVKELFPDEADQWLRNGLQAAEPGRLAVEAPLWLDLLGIPVPEQKDYLTQFLLQKRGATQALEELGRISTGVVTHSAHLCFSQQELHDFAMQILDSDSTDIFYQYSLSILENFLPAETLSKHITATARKTPELVLASLTPFCIKYLARDEIENLLDYAVRNNHVGFKHTDRNDTEVMVKFIGKDRYKRLVCDLLDFGQSYNLTDSGEGLGGWVEVFSEYEKNEIMEHIYKTNPFILLPIGGYDGSARMAAIEAIDHVVPNLSQLRLAPKALPKLWQRYKQAVSAGDYDNEYSYHEALRKLCDQTAVIRQYGLEDTALRLVANTKRTVENEQQILGALAALVRNGATAEDLAGVDTITQLQEKLLADIAKLVGDTGEVSETALHAAFPNPIPLYIYADMWKRSPEQTAFLSDMMRGISQDGFAAWRSGEADPANFERFVEAGILPGGLDHEQYREWSADHAFAAEVTETSGNNIEHLSNLVNMNAQHLADMPPLLWEQPGNRQHRLLRLKDKRRELGQQLELAHASGDTKQAFELRRAMDAVNVHQAVAKLLDAHANGTANAKTTHASLRKLQALLPEQDKFVVSQLAQAMEASSLETLSTDDNANAQTWIEIGEKPVRSCQHYDGGSYNAGLVGYTEPNVRIVVARNEKNSIVGRSILRLMATSEGQPALMLEPIYAAAAPAQVTHAIQTHARKIAALLGTSIFTQVEAGKETEQLHTSGLRAPATYSDSINDAFDGLMQRGQTFSAKVAPLN